MLLDLIVHNPAGDSAITWVGAGIVAALATAIAALWVVLARRIVHPDDEGASDSAAEVLRHRRLVVLRPRKSRDPKAAVVSELDPTTESEPTGR
jgi:hypothetical protein